MAWDFFFNAVLFFFIEDCIITDGQHKLERQSSSTGEGQDFVKHPEAEVCIRVAL